MNTTDKLHLIRAACAEFYGITEQEMKSNCRKRKYVIARHTYCYFSRRLGATLQQTGDGINKDHATVKHAVRQFETLRDWNGKRVEFIKLWRFIKRKYRECLVTQDNDEFSRMFLRDRGMI